MKNKILKDGLTVSGKINHHFVNNLTQEEIKLWFELLDKKLI